VRRFITLESPDRDVPAILNQRPLPSAGDKSCRAPPRHGLKKYRNTIAHRNGAFCRSRVARGNVRDRRPRHRRSDPIRSD